MKNPMEKNGLTSLEESRNQRVGDKTREMHANNGAPVVDDEANITAGQRGPTLLQDHWLLEKNAHFNREVIPERRMHAKGSGAFGTFTVTNDITKYTKAKIEEMCK